MAGRQKPGAGSGRNAPRARAASRPAEGAGERSRPPRPKALHRYGQNHLVDGNILRAIIDQAAVTPGDVVLEVGAAGGLLTRPLLERAGVVHAFEIDARWQPSLRALADQQPGLRLHAGDALKADLHALDPAPTALVANLAYNIAIPLIMTSIDELPTVERWAVMVQKELGDRLFAKPSTKAYAAVSVLTQLACRLEKARPVPPSAFRPQPRVDSSFVTFVRRPLAFADPGAAAAPGGGAGAAVEPRPSPAEYAALSQLVRIAFGQRRKTLGNSLNGATRDVVLTRETVQEALGVLGLSAAARPEELAPRQWVAFATALGWLPPDQASRETT